MYVGSHCNFTKGKLIADLKNKYELITTLSHQLRTPITHLQWQIAAKETPGKEKETKAMLKTDIAVLNSIIDRLLLYTEITNKKIQLDKKPIPVDALYKSIFDKLAISHDVSRIQFTKAKSTSPTVHIDEKKITTALMYIIENALVYSPKNTKVAVEIKKEGTFLVFRVTDKGYGIPEKEQRKVFSEFFRSSNASLGINYGSGVSLFISKIIIEAHGGSIDFVSTEKKGTKFSVTLPLA